MAPRISHFLTVYDGGSEQCIEAVKIELFQLDSFAKHFDVLTDDDPEMLDRYSVTPLDLDFLKPFLPEEFYFDFQQYAYFVEPLQP